MTDESPSHTIQAPEKHVHLEDAPNGPSSQSMPVASVSTTAGPLLSDTVADHVPEAPSSSVELAKHSSDLNEILNDTTTAAPSSAQIPGGTNEATHENSKPSLAYPSTSDSPLTKVGNDNGSTQAMPKTIEPETEDEREVLEEKDPLGVVERDVTERNHTAEREDEDTVAKDLKSPLKSGSHKNSPPMHQRDDSTDVGLARSPQPWDLVEPPETNGRAEFYSPGGPKAYGSTPNKPRPSIPHSSYYFGPPPLDSAYGSPPIGQIGVHHPREILRVERDYTGGELIQFAPVYPLELEGRISPTQFLESINAINELLISAHSLRHSFFDNMLAVVTLQMSKLVLSTHYEKEMRRLERLIGDLNAELYNPVGLNIIWPRKVAFLFLELEYY